MYASDLEVNENYNFDNYESNNTRFTKRLGRVELMLKKFISKLLERLLMNNKMKMRNV